MQENHDVVAVNVAKRWALTQTGTMLPISHLYDAEGYLTDDPDEAVTGTCCVDDIWLAVDLTQFEEVNAVH